MHFNRSVSFSSEFFLFVHSFVRNFQLFSLFAIVTICIVHIQRNRFCRKRFYCCTRHEEKLSFAAMLSVHQTSIECERKRDHVMSTPCAVQCERDELENWHARRLMRCDTVAKSNKKSRWLWTQQLINWNSFLVCFRLDRVDFVHATNKIGQKIYGQRKENQNKRISRTKQKRKLSSIDNFRNASNLTISPRRSHREREYEMCAIRFISRCTFIQVTHIRSRHGVAVCVRARSRMRRSKKIIYKRFSSWFCCCFFVRFGSALTLPFIRCLAQSFIVAFVRVRSSFTATTTRDQNRIKTNEEEEKERRLQVNERKNETRRDENIEANAWTKHTT